MVGVQKLIQFVDVANGLRVLTGPVLSTLLTFSWSAEERSEAVLATCNKKEEQTMTFIKNNRPIRTRP